MAIYILFPMVNNNNIKLIPKEFNENLAYILDIKFAS